MDTSESSELEQFREAIAKCLAAAWPGGISTAEAADRLPYLWREILASGQATIGHPDSGFGIEAAIVAAIAHGAAGSPAAIIPAIILNLACHGSALALVAAMHAGGAIPAVAYAEYDGDIATGTASFGDGKVDGIVQFIEDAGQASHFVIFVEEGLAIVERTAPGVAIDEMPGLVRPAFHRLTLESVPAVLVGLDHAQLSDLALVARLLYAARASGAARTAFSLAAEHAATRKQFGKFLAQFQAMQHKLANGEIALRGSDELLHHAAKLYDAENGDWRLFAEAAIAFSSSHLRQTSIETHHALGAIGYAEEHDAPGHFRRVHGDLCRMGGVMRARRALFAAVRSRAGEGLPGIWLGARAEGFRQEVRRWLSTHWDEAARIAENRKTEAARGLNLDFCQRLAAAGLLSASWPKAFGGKDLGFREQLVLNEELEGARAPYSLAVCISWILAPLIIRHGQDALKTSVLPRARRGEIVAALGYSEPEAGSDLSNLKTRAVRDGDDYVISGQKLWGTLTDKATHILVAARTDPEAQPRRNGISLFVVPAGLPGITVQPHMAFYGHRFCTQFYDEVRVPAWSRLGDENGGWALLAEALVSERIFMGGKVRKLALIFDKIVAHLAEREACADVAPLGALAAEVLAARLFAVRSVLALEGGQTPIVEGAIAKVFSGELAERLCETAIDLVGTGGLLGGATVGAPLDGILEHELRTSLMMVIGGGAAEIQRSIIAQQGLGMPR